MGRKKIPTVGVFPTVLVFSYGQINPTVKMPRLGCTQFVVPLKYTVIQTTLGYERESEQTKQRYKNRERMRVTKNLFQT